MADAMTSRIPPGGLRYRAATVEVDRLATRAAGDDRIPVSLSSEAPVEMRYGTEILVHTREAVDFRHVVNGALPFLDGHDSTRQLGVVEDVRLGPDRRLRGMLRKGNHPDAEWMFRDIAAGLRPNISLGYIVSEYDPNQRNALRATRWTP